MKKGFRTALLGGLIAGAALLLGGCGLLKPVESLYALPALPEEYSQLQRSIQSVIDEMNAEYATINYGSNTATIQMLDLDGDHEQETAAVFLRAAAAEEKPLRICLFRRGFDDAYQLTYTIQGEGSSINSVAYEDLTGDTVREVIVSWQISAKVHILSAYQLSSAGAEELMSTTYNETYLTCDLDRDSKREIIVFQQHSTDSESNRAEYYRFQDGAMVMTSAAPLSENLTDITSVRTGLLADGVPGVYATGEFVGGVLTDVLTLTKDELTNVTRDKEVGISQATVRTYTDVAAADINLDGIMEIPLPVPLTNLDPELPPAYYMLYWRQYDSLGGSTVTGATYHAVSNGWYLNIPSDWLGKVTVGYDDSRSSRGERAVVFYYWPDVETTGPRAFLTIYRLTGDNRYSRAQLSGRKVLHADSSTIYCAAMNADSWDSGVELADVGSLFHLITTEWSTQ